MTNLQSDMSSFMPENDFVELLWENGQIVMQGQSNRPKKLNISTVFPSTTSRTTTQEKYVSDSLKTGRIDSVVNDISPAAPNTGLNSQDDDLVPWMNYPMKYHLESDYCSDFFSEFPGLNVNSLSNSNNLGGVPRESQNVELEHSTTPLAGGIDSSRSKLSRTPEACGGNSSSKNKLDVPTTKPLPTSCGTGVMNFSHFSRPVALVKANLENVDRLRNNKNASTPMSCNPIESTLVDSSSGLKSVSVVQEKMSPTPPPPPQLRTSVRPNKEAIYSEDAQRHDGQSITNNCRRLQDLYAHHQGSSQTQIVAEKGPEAVVASSVCSGNSAGANDVKQRRKKKNREGDESAGYQSEDVEDESIGIKNPARGKGLNAKRSRAAEVHNLSERRRRDRINERMRALQELIPNCNKVDKASMLDEAIEYLKTLQLQVQIMSMGSGLCLPPMMLPTGMQHLRGPPLAHFPPQMSLGMGMGMGMGYGMGMLDINGTPGWQLPGMGMPGSSSVQMLGTPGQFGMSGMSMARPPPPFASFPGPLIKGPEISGAGPSSTPQGGTAVQQHVTIDGAQKSCGIDILKAHAQV